MNFKEQSVKDKLYKLIVTPLEKGGNYSPLSLFTSVQKVFQGDIPLHDVLLTQFDCPVDFGFQL